VLVNLNLKIKKEVKLMSKNMYPALSAVLNQNKITLEKDEFKIVLDLINGKDVKSNKELTPVAQLVLHVFDQQDLQDDEFYLVYQEDAVEFGTFHKIVVKNRSQLLDTLMNKTQSNANISVLKFGDTFQ
jgi:hypothetical protein